MQWDYDDLEGSCASGPSRTKAFGSPIPKTGKPIRVILDLTTPLEALTGGLTIASLAGVVICSLLAMSDTGVDSKKEWTMAIFSAVALVLFGWSWWYSDCYYVMDGKQKKLLYHFSFMGITRETEISRFEGIREISIDAKERYAKRKYHSYYYWEYMVVVVLRGGTRVRVSNEVREPEKITGDARRAADVVGCDFVPEGESTPYKLFGSFFG
jgi:hypothetical protein